MSENLIVIDADPGVDDALALLLATSREAGHLSNVLAITTVRGNIGIDQVCLNTMRVLQVAGRLDIPVYRGTDRPLIGETATSTASYYHGKDGLGEVPDKNAPDLSLVQTENAVLALIRLANQHPGKITLVCLSPLTNIAIALRICPAFGTKLRHCIIMGGNTTGKGNITSNAEYNFYADPEAANVVLHELGCRISLIPWELCLENSLPWDIHDEIFAAQSRRSRFMNQIYAHSIREYYGGRETENKDRQKFHICDEIAVALAVDERVATATVEMPCCVESTGALTRGQMVIERQLLTTSYPTTVRVVTAVNLERCIQLLTAALAD